MKVEGLGDHCPSLLHVADTVSPLQVKLRVDPSSTGDGGVSMRVTLLAGSGLEGQATKIISTQRMKWCSGKHI